LVLKGRVRAMWITSFDGLGRSHGVLAYIADLPPLHNAREEQ
jgi:hypothetical protein